MFPDRPQAQMSDFEKREEVGAIALAWRMARAAVGAILHTRLARLPQPGAAVSRA